MTEPILQAKGVTRRYGSLMAVNGIDLTLQSGEFLALLGPNGAGKTTLIEMIEGIQLPDAGSIQIMGMSWNEREKEIRRLIGVALQETRFYDRLTTEETLRMFATFYDATDRIQEILDLVRLTDKRKVYTMGLSGGQRQRLALGVALLNNPALLLLDEPTTGLDPNARRDVWAILQDLKSRGVTMILTTHYMEEAENLCERIIIMDQGRFLASGTMNELLRNQGGGDILEFSLEPQALNSPDLHSDWSDTPGFIALEKPGQGRLRIIVSDVRPALQYLMQRLGPDSWNLRELVCRRMNLDDLFTRMTGRHLDHNATEN
ncbi:MAG: ABC transporter ATP-binding protein [Spirochaetaceae bacterium]|nr:ABC transporter ATP-binding protein [Spirochaetaceae bacterium]